MGRGNEMLTRHKDWMRADTINAIRLQIQGLCALGLSTSKSILQPRPGRLPHLSYQQIHPFRTWVSRKIRQFLLLFPRLQIHHQNHPPRRAQSAPQDTSRLLRPHPGQPGHAIITVLRPPSGQGQEQTARSLCSDEQPIPAAPRYSSPV